MSFPPPRLPMIPPPPTIRTLPPPMVRPPFPFGMIPPPIRPMIRPPIVPTNLPPKEKPPTTKVYVGNISERAPDMLIRQMLQRCGAVVSWKRPTGLDGKLQTFGFCEFDNPDSTLRCIRLLNGYQIADRNLSVKADQKTREQLAEHIRKTKMMDTKNAKKAAMQQARSGAPTDSDSVINLEIVDENNLKEDRIVINTFEILIRQYEKEMIPLENQAEITPTLADAPSSSDLKASEATPNATPEIDEKKKEYESAIREKNVKEEKKSKPVEKEKERERERERERPKEREKNQLTPDRHDKERDRERERNNRDRARSRTKSRSPQSARKRPASPPRPQPEEDTEEARERKRLERKLREKEMAYRERLNAWESRESKKRNEYSAEKKKERQRKKQMQKDAKKLRQFLEDYDDAKDDAEHFKGVVLEKKKRQRERELDADRRDREREREELDELKRKLIDKGIEDVENEIKRIQSEEQTKMKHKFDKLEQSTSSEDEKEEEEETEEHRKIETDKENKNGAEPNDPSARGFQQARPSEANGKHDTENAAYSPNSSSNSPMFGGVTIMPKTIKTTMLKTKSQSTVQPINQLFQEEDEEQQLAKLKKARLVDSEERKRAVKKLVESIPVDRDELFVYNIDWEQLDASLMEKRIKPWINKKIIEYIGEEEPTLNEFICSKIQQRARPEKLLEEIKVVLDEEAELFVTKMWRLIVYETESKRCGLSK